MKALFGFALAVGGIGAGVYLGLRLYNGPPPLAAGTPSGSTTTTTTDAEEA